MNTEFCAFIAYPTEMYDITEDDIDKIINDMLQKYDTIISQYTYYDDGIEIVGNYDKKHDIVHIADEIIKYFNAIHSVKHTNTKDMTICYTMNFRKTKKNASIIDKIFCDMVDNNDDDNICYKLYADGIRLIGCYENITNKGKNMFKLLDDHDVCVYKFVIMNEY